MGQTPSHTAWHAARGEGLPETWNAFGCDAYAARWEGVMDKAELYRAAADLLRRDGWCQYSYEDERRHCMAGALSAIKGHRLGNHHGAYDDIYGALASVLGTRCVAHFNDAYGMTADDAIAALEIAADLATSSP